MTSPLYSDLKHHMTVETQKAMNRVAKTAIGAVEDSELFMMMISTGVDTTCAAIGSLAASAASGDNRHVDASLNTR